MIEETLKECIRNAVHERGYSFVEEVHLEHPTEFAHGDYATNIAMVLAKTADKNPRELADEVLRYIEIHKPSEVEKAEVAGPGFINFYLTADFFKASVGQILKAREGWGKGNLLAGKKVMVEYTQPNPFKPFHIGHLMSNAIGESLSRIIEAQGAEIFKANYQGDVGLHVGKTIWGLQQKQLDPHKIDDLSQAYVYGNAQYEESDQAKQEIQKINKHVYTQDDDTVNEIYRIGREVSLQHFEELYDKLGTKFNANGYFFESDVWHRGKELVEQFTGSVFTKSDGAIVFAGDEKGLHTRVFITSQGLPTYEAKDLGLAYAKQERFPFDISITTTAVEQAPYFSVVFEVLKEMDAATAGKYQHVAHGMMQLASGKMSSRKGNIVTGESLIEDVEKIAHDKLTEHDLTDKDRLATDIAVAAIKYSILKQTAGKNITFDFEKSLSFEGNSGPYLQYTAARTRSVLKKAEAKELRATTDQSLDAITDIERLLYRFPNSVSRAAREYEPHYIATYLTELAAAFNSFYGQERILDDDEHVGYKLALTKAVHITLTQGLHLLGIRTPDRM